MKSLSLSLVVLTVLSAAKLAPADERPAADPTKKRVVEKPVNDIVKQSAVQPKVDKPKVRLDVTKGFRVEAPIKRLVEKAPETGHTTVADNPRVEPGKVRWHGSLDEARQASVKSNKPVLLFQMMGNLDDRFC